MRYKRNTPTWIATGSLAIGLAAGLALMAGAPWVSRAYAEEAAELSPTKARPRDTYYPNTEDLAPDEMRVIACGTGMPTTRMKQVAACFLVELGNGDKFLFDAGSGSAERISALQIPYNYLDKIFVGHLHSDHFAAVPEYRIGGALMGRNQPLRI
jgi:ribonuclease Z